MRRMFYLPQPPKRDSFRYCEERSSLFNSEIDFCIWGKIASQSLAMTKQLQLKAPLGV